MLPERSGSMHYSQLKRQISLTQGDTNVRPGIASAAPGLRV